MSEPSRNPISRSRRRRSTPAVALGARMVPFAGYRHAGAVSATASSRSISTRAAPPGCSTSRIWVRHSLIGSDHATAAARARGAGARRYPQSRARPAALHAAPQRRRRHPRRSHGHALRRSGGGRRADARRQCGAQGGRLCAHRRAPAGERQAAARRAPRAARAAGAESRAGDGAARARCRRRSPSCRRRSTSFDGIDCHVSRSGYTGEDGFEISVKATRAVAIAERLLDDAERQADRPRRPRLAAAGSGALPLRPRHRRDHVAGRGRADVVDPEAAARGRRLSRRRAHARGAGERPGAPARRPAARRPRAGARRRRDPCDRRRADRPGHLRRLRADRRRTDRHGLRRAPLRRAGHRGRARRARARNSPPRSWRCRSCRIAIFAVSPSAV